MRVEVDDENMYSLLFPDVKEILDKKKQYEANYTFGKLIEEF